MAPKATAKVTPRKKTDTVAVKIFEIFFSLQIVSNYHNIKIIMKKYLKNEILSKQGKTKSEEKSPEN